jgi:hypothetical protein
MSPEFQKGFIDKLEEQYGPWEKSTSRFGSTSYGKVSKDLCISPSQFSKLIYGNATEGMYLRSIRNIERLIREQETRTQLLESKALLDEERAKGQKIRSGTKGSNAKIIFFSILGLLIGSFGTYEYITQTKKPAIETESSLSHPLEAYFEHEFGADFDSPFLNESEVQEYCPCSAYEGKWSLYKPFKLPLPGSRAPGLYYLAKEADMRLKCSKIDEVFIRKGNALAGYEYLISEIWIDTKQTPLIPQYFDAKTKSFTVEFDTLKFENNPQFKKVATLVAFNVNKFYIYPDSIVRHAEITGRFASEVDESLTLSYNIDIKHILENVLGNLVKTDCQSSPNPFCNPNDLKENESVISFDCVYTIQAENLGIGGGYPYTKGFLLEKQNYSDNLTCRCGDE